MPHNQRFYLNELGCPALDEDDLLPKLGAVCRRYADNIDVSSTQCLRSDGDQEGGLCRTSSDPFWTLQCASVSNSSSSGVNSRSPVTVHHDQNSHGVRPSLPATRAEGRAPYFPPFLETPSTISSDCSNTFRSPRRETYHSCIASTVAPPIQVPTSRNPMSCLHYYGPILSPETSILKKRPYATKCSEETSNGTDAEFCRPGRFSCLHPAMHGCASPPVVSPSFAPCSNSSSGTSKKTRLLL